jgi:pseudouridine kinase
MPSTTESPLEVVVIGAACLDVKARLRGDTLAGTSNPGDVRLSIGGCARNIAENLARLGTNTVLLSAVCEDDFGQTIIRHTARAGVNTQYVLRSCEERSAAYIALLGSQGQLLVGVDDTLATTALTPDYIADHATLLSAARMVVLDANVPVDSAKQILAICADAGVPVALDPAAYGPAQRYRDLVGSFTLVVLNEIEAQAITDVTILSEAQAIQSAKQLVSMGVEIAIITRAEAGLVYATGDMNGNVPAVVVEVVDPTGAGDALAAVRLGVSAAALTLGSVETVRQDLSLESLYAQLVI